MVVSDHHEHTIRNDLGICSGPNSLLNWPWFLCWTGPGSFVEVLKLVKMYYYEWSQMYFIRCFPSPRLKMAKRWAKLRITRSISSGWPRSQTFCDAGTRWKTARCWPLKSKHNPRKTKSIWWRFTNSPFLQVFFVKQSSVRWSGVLALL